MKEITVQTSELRNLVTWLKEINITHSPHTHRAYKNGWKLYLDFMRNNSGSSLMDYRQYLEEKYTSKQTKNLRLSALRAFYTWQAEQGLIEYAPVIRGIKKSKQVIHKREALTNEEVRNLLATCKGSPIDIRDYCVMSLMLYSGLRIVECQRADVKDIKTRKGRMTIDVQGKGHTEKDDYNVIPTHQEEYIRAWLNVRNGNPEKALFVDMRKENGGRLTTRTITRLVHNRMVSSGIVKRVGQGMRNTKTVHSLRHTALTNAIDNDAQLLQAQQMARHKNPETTLIYLSGVNRLKSPAEDLINYKE